MVDVFISYSRNDHAHVAMLARAVEAEGYEVWWDADLPPHQSYGDVITAKIGAARAAIVVWSADAAKSDWVRAEADMARNQKKLVQTAIGDVMPPLPFNQIQFVDIGAWQGEPDHPGWRKVKASLAELCGEGADPREQQKPASPSPQPMRAAAAPSALRWPLLAGGGVAVVALATLGGVLVGRQGGSPVASDPTVSASGARTSAAPSAEPTVYVTEKVRVIAAPAPAPAPVTEAPGPVPGTAKVIFPDSSVRLLDAGEIDPLTAIQARIARNEIFAREGRAFKDPSLRAYFAQFSWYRPTGFVVRLNPIEARNVALLSQAEGRVR